MNAQEEQAMKSVMDWAQGVLANKKASHAQKNHASLVILKALGMKHKAPEDKAGSFFD